MERLERLATTGEVARYLRLNSRTLGNWAYQGKGPRFVKIGGVRRYAWSDVQAWVEAQKEGGK